MIVVARAPTEIGLISDAAERKRIEALHALGILDTPFEERFDRVTRLATRFFGVPKAAVTLIDVNRQWFKACVGMDDRETELEMSICTHAVKRGEQLVIEDALADPLFAQHPAVTQEDGVRFYAGQPLHLSGGEIPGTLCVFDSEPRGWTEEEAESLRDLAAIIERELASEEVEDLLGELVRTTARARAVADAAAEGIIVLTTEGRVEFANNAAEAMLGYEQGRLADVDLHAAVHGEGADCEGECELARAIANAGNLPSERSTFCRADGEPVPVEVASEPVVERGRVTGSVVTFADITRQVELERAKDEFAAHVTHDLRSPLTTIRGYTEFVRQRDALGDEERDQLAAVLRGTERLERLIDDLLVVSKLDAEAGAREPVDLSAVVRELGVDLAAAHAGSEVRVDSEAPDELLVEADREQLQRALANLGSNAAKFSPKGGVVTIRASREGDRCSVSISDQGPGIPADEIERLGERFFRASTSAGVMGTGLGLAVAREVAEAHGGALQIESEVGEGSTFRLELPCAEG